MRSQVPQASTGEMEKAFFRVEVWLRRGDQLRRLYGSRTSDAELAHPGRVRLVLQPYENGQVVAWRPEWTSWVSLIEAQSRLNGLLREGWEVVSSPARLFERAKTHLSPEERKEHRKAWDRMRKRRSRQSQGIRQLTAA